MEKETMENALDQSQKRGRLSYGTDLLQLHDEEPTAPSKGPKSLLSKYCKDYGLYFPEKSQEALDQEVCRP